MPTPQEWTDCRTAAGRLLPRTKCNAYRALFGLEPLPESERLNPVTATTRPCQRPEAGAGSPPRPPAPPRKIGGPGTELAKLLQSVGITKCLPCTGRAMRMDNWGASGCREHREEIRQWMLVGMESATWWVKTKAAALAIAQGLMVDPADPAGWLVDEAIRRAEAAEKPCETSCPA